MTIRVKRAVVEDAAELAGLCDVVHRLHLDRRPDVFRPIPLDALGTWFEATLRDPKVSVWLAEADARALGYLLVVSQERPETLFCQTRRWCELDQIAVLPGQRRRGVARALVERAMAEARAAGVDHFEVQCWGFNEVAQSVFGRLGFSPKMVRLEWPGP